MSLSIVDTLRQEFKDKSQTSKRLHYIMTHHEHKENGVKLSQCIEVIRKLGVGLNKPAGSKNWTPISFFCYHYFFF